ncbi:MAG: hypothetical protein KJO75_17770 [Dactylosporangium sp.]|nr:hypothetical protein [Dactylosporangium sp.]
MLLALATRAEEAWLRWHAGRAAVRARDQVPGRTEAFAHHVQANLCLLAAISAADLPTGFKIYDVSLSKDPHTAARQLRKIVVAYYPSGPIETEQEAARLAYKAAYAESITDQEQRYVDLFAALPAARRDKIIELVEDRARYPRER